LESHEKFENLKSPKVEFCYKNIIPIPSFLIKAFIELPSFDPYSVAKAFFDEMEEFANFCQAPLVDSPKKSNISANNNNEENSTHQQDQNDNENGLDFGSPEMASNYINLVLEFVHVIQFCHLCTKGKIPPVLYTLSTSPEIQDRFLSISPVVVTLPKHAIQRKTSSFNSSDLEDDEISSPERKVSRKDHFIINTMLKLHESMDKNNLKQTLEKEEKEPGYSKLEPYHKNLILNASATPPFDVKANKPTKFYTTFLSKKSQFKAKDMILQRFHLDKIAFIPSTSFIANLWNCNFFWTLPDSPSGVSIYYCPETKSINASDLEKERNFALADKVKIGDIDRLAEPLLTKLCYEHGLDDPECPIGDCSMFWKTFPFSSIP